MPLGDTMDGVQSGSRVGLAVRKLADISAQAQEGAYLGAEDELLARIGVSRPTLRQAAKILESERFIRIRPGQGGGFFAARPSAHDVIRAPARYLRLKGASLEQVYGISRLVAEEAAAAAALCEDEAMIDALRHLRVTFDGEAPNAPELIQQEAQLARLLARMSGNPAIELFIEISFSFGFEEQNVRFYEAAEDRAWAREAQRKLCDAVLGQDADIARIVARRRSDKFAEWFAREKR